MNFLRKITVKQKLQLIVAMASVGLAIVLYIAITDISTMSEETSRTYSLLQLAAAQSHADMEHDALWGRFYQALNSKSLTDADRQKFMGEVREHADDFKKAIETVRTNATEPELQALVASLKEPLDTYLASCIEYTQVALNDHALGESHAADMDARYRALEGPMDRVSQKIDGYSESIKVEAADIASKTRNVLLILSLVIMGIIIGFSYAVGLTIISSVTRLRGAASAVTKGEYSARVEVVGSDDLAKLSIDFNSMVESLQSAMKEAQAEREHATELMKHSEELTQKAEQYSQYLDSSVNTMIEAMQRLGAGDLTTNLSAEGDDAIANLYRGFNTTVSTLNGIVENVRSAIEATASASSQISSSTEQMAAGATEQSSQTNDAVCAVEEMTKIIMENSMNARQTASATEQAKISAETGGTVIQQTVSGMERIAHVVRESATTVKALGESSAHIGEIITVINDIADQTNLLALNAAIEAARAGEQGRGFAVVADEVRKLAERTTNATKEISEMIKKIQVDTVEAVTSIDEGNREVEHGMKLADKASSALNDIVGAVSNVSTMIGQIAIASEEQSNASEQISRNIEAINAVTAETATGTQQIARAAEDLNRLTENLHRLVGHFRLVDSAHDHNSKHHTMAPDAGLRRAHPPTVSSPTYFNRN